MKRFFLFFAGAAISLSVASCGETKDNSGDSTGVEEVTDVADTNTDKTEIADWTGVYFAEEEAGPGMGGEPRYYEYNITVVKTDAGYTADFDIDGYQTMSRVNCTATDEGGKLVLKFASYDEDNMGDDSQTPGEIVATLNANADGSFSINDGYSDLKYVKK